MEKAANRISRWGARPFQHGRKSNQPTLDYCSVDLYAEMVNSIMRPSAAADGRNMD